MLSCLLVRALPPQTPLFSNLIVDRCYAPRSHLPCIYTVNVIGLPQANLLEVEFISRLFSEMSDRGASNVNWREGL